MVDHYIHTLTFSTRGTPSVYNEEAGMWSETIPGSPITIPCRANPAGAGSTAREENGTEVSYAFDLGFPFEVTTLPKAHDMVTLNGVDGEILWGGPLIRIQRGEFSIRGWL